MAALTGAGMAIVGGSVLSGAMGARSASKAAKAQAKGVNSGIAEQRRQFDVTQQSMQPFTQTGKDALNQQRILLGLGGLDPSAQQRNDFQSQISSIQNRERPRGIMGMMSDSSLSRVLGDQPRTEQLQEQIQNLPQGTQLSAEEQQQAAFDKLANSPGQQFLRDRAQKNLLRNSSAIGGLGGGNVRSALVQQGVGFAQQDIDNQFGRLGQLAGQGLAATTNVGQFGQDMANNVSQGMTNIGNARASGITNKSNAIQNAFGGILGGAAQGGFFGGGGTQSASGSLNNAASGAFSGFNPFAR